jgi:hypothetical protein
MARPTNGPSKFLRNDGLHPADHSADQTHFYAVRVSGRIGKNLPNGSLGQFPGTLILFLYNLYPDSRTDISSFFAVYW